MIQLKSLRLRMMSLAVVWVAGSLIAAGFALQYLFGLNLERSAQEDMAAALTRLAAVIVPADIVSDIGSPLPDPRYTTPFGGRYWQIEALDSQDIARSRSLWDFVLEPAQADGQVHHQEGPLGRHVMVLTRRLTIDNREFLVTVGQDHAPIHEATQRFGRDLAQVMLVLGVLIVLAAWVQIRVGLSPIQHVRHAIEGVRRGSVGRLEGPFPSELQPLVQEVNGLLEAREALTDRARARAADLAHGLKTPLAAIQGIAERLRDRGINAEADVLQDLSFEMSRRVDYQMRLATLRVRTTSHSTRSSLNAAILRTLTVIKKTARGERLHWVAELTDECWVDIHRQDLMELVGITLENAAKWASSKVVVRSERAGDRALLVIADDGPGIPEEQLKSLGVRGVRLDQSLPGSGLGLSIAAEILVINGGSMEFSNAPAGGLVVTLLLPLSNAADDGEG